MFFFRYCIETDAELELFATAISLALYGCSNELTAPGTTIFRGPFPEPMCAGKCDRPVDSCRVE